MSLRTRLLTVLLALLAIVAVGGTVGGVLVASRDRDNAALRDLTTARRRVEQLTTTYLDQQNALIGYLVTNQELLLRPYTDGIATSERLSRLVQGDLRAAPRLRPLVTHAERVAAALRRDTVDPVIALRRRGQTGAALRRVLSPAVRSRSDDLRSTLVRLGNQVDAAIRSHTRSRNSTNHWLFIDLLATIVAAILGVLAATVLIERWTKRPIDAIAHAVRLVREGALRTPVPAVGPPELADLGRDVDEMRARIIRELSESERAREALEQNATVVLALRRLLEPETGDMPAGWHVATGLRPAEGFVAGDSYDVAFLPDGRLAVVVIDIAGHGAVSAVASLRCQELLAVALADGREPGDALTWLLEQIRDPGVELFFSAFIATIDPVTGQCRYANAGHPSPLLAREAGIVELPPTGPIVGPVVATWDSVETTIEPGTSLAIYTDGLTDPRNVRDAYAPLDRLVELLLDGVRPDADAVVRGALHDLETRSGGRLRDDVTLVVLCRDERETTGAS